MNIKDKMMKWYPIGIAFVCLLYSVGLGLTGHTEEAIYSAHWPGTILLFSIAINQINRQWIYNRLSKIYQNYYVKGIISIWFKWINA